jgi:hypothetical protein
VTILKQRKNDKAVVLVEFVMHLFISRGLSANEVTMSCSALSTRFAMNCKGRDPFEHASVRMAKEACRADPRLQNIAKEMRRRMPVTVDMIDKHRELYWGQDVDRAMTYVGTVLAFNFMWRVSEYVFTKDSDDHTLRADDVLYITKKGRAGNRKFLFPWQVRGRSMNSEVVDTVLFVVRSSKADRQGKGRYLYLRRRSVRESRLVDDLVHWAQWSGVQSKMPYLSRIHNGRTKLLTRRMINESLKAVATAMGFDTMIFAFSSHSLRIGGATALISSGASRDSVKRVGGWAEESNCDNIYYANTALDAGALSVERMGFIDHLTVDEVKLLVPTALLRTLADPE